MKTIVMTVSITLLLAVVAGLILVYSGAFNVAVSWKDPALMRWVLVSTRENSIERRAASIEVMPIQGAEQIENGFRSYREMCVDCHALPGMDESALAKGLNPAPPILDEEAEHMSAAELFWVVKNGIRMTGMPGWGITHDDAELWDIVAFLKKMPEMDEADFTKLDSQLTKGHESTNDEGNVGHDAAPGH